MRWMLGGSLEASFWRDDCVRRSLVTPGDNDRTRNVYRSSQWGVSGRVGSTQRRQPVGDSKARERVSFIISQGDDVEKECSVHM